MKKTVILIALTLSFFSCKQEHHVYTLHSGDITLTVTDFGARVMSLTTPDRGGTPENIVVGHKTVEEYVHPAGERFLGACVGPVANRIGGVASERGLDAIAAKRCTCKAGLPFPSAGLNALLRVFA